MIPLFVLHVYLYIKTFDHFNRIKLIYLHIFRGGNPEGSGTVTLTIAVEDVNDNAPIFEQTLYRAMITSLDGITQGRLFFILTGFLISLRLPLKSSKQMH